MIEFDTQRCLVKPMKHQIIGTKLLLKNKAFALFDEQGVCKSKQFIDAACALREAREIDSVVVICPANVRSAWDSLDEILPGEIKLHSYIKPIIIRWNSRSAALGGSYEIMGDYLPWLITNYEFIRNEERLKQLLKFLPSMRRFILGLDETDMIKSRTAKQSKAVRWVRSEAKRCVLLSGTPYANNLLDLWNQMHTLDPASVFNMKYREFQHRYVITQQFEAANGGRFEKVTGYHVEEVEKLKTHLKRWVIRREKDELPDLPPKVYERLEVPLDGDSWRLYREMRDEMVAWAKSGQPMSIAVNGGVKLMRLAQICGGFLGTGVEDEAPNEVGREKLDSFLDWQSSHAETIIVWAHFRAELERLFDALRDAQRPAFMLIGGQTSTFRDAQLQGFRTTKGSVLVGQAQAGGRGLNLQNAKTVCYLSNSHRLVTRLQSEDRAHRMGQKEKVTYVDFLATTPKGNQTADHLILKSLVTKESMAEWTYNKWVRALTGD